MAVNQTGVGKSVSPPAPTIPDVLLQEDDHKANPVYFPELLTLLGELEDIKNDPGRLRPISSSSSVSAAPVYAAASAFADAIFAKVRNARSDRFAGEADSSMEVLAPVTRDLVQWEMLLYLDEKYRDHFIHQLQVFLLGSMIISRNKDLFNKYAPHALLRERDRGASFRDSEHRECACGKPAYECACLEFGWALTALMHDHAYPIQEAGSLFADSFKSFLNVDDPKIELFPDSILLEGDHLQKLDATASCFRYFENWPHDKKPNGSWCPFEHHDTCSGNGKASGRRVAEGCPQFRAVVRQRMHGEPRESVSPDGTEGQTWKVPNHCTYSALALLNKYSSDFVCDGHGVNCGLKAHSEIARFTRYITIPSAVAISMHHMFDQDVKSLRIPGFHHSRHPLVFLLRFCDVVQEWSRQVRPNPDAGPVSPILSDSLKDLVVEKGKVQVVLDFPDSSEGHGQLECAVWELDQALGDGHKKGVLINDVAIHYQVVLKKNGVDQKMYDLPGNYV